MYKLKIYKEKEEFYQTGCIAMWEACQTFDDTRGNFEMYVYSLVKYTMIREMNIANRFSEANTCVQDEVLIPLIGMTQTDELFEGEYFEQLSGQEQQMIKYIYADKMPNEEIAQQMNCSMEALKKRRQRTLKKIQFAITNRVAAKE